MIVATLSPSLPPRPPPSRDNRAPLPFIACVALLPLFLFFIHPPASPLLLNGRRDCRKLSHPFTPPSSVARGVRSREFASLWELRSERAPDAPQHAMRASRKNAINWFGRFLHDSWCFARRNIVPMTMSSRQRSLCSYFRDPAVRDSRDSDANETEQHANFKTSSSWRKKR